MVHCHPFFVTARKHKETERTFPPAPCTQAVRAHRGLPIVSTCQRWSSSYFPVHTIKTHRACAPPISCGARPEFILLSPYQYLSFSFLFFSFPFRTEYHSTGSMLQPFIEIMCTTVTIVLHRLTCSHTHSHTHHVFVLVRLPS